MTPYKLHPSARKELEQAVRYYRKQDREVAVRFFEVAQASILHLCEYPDSGHEILEGFRRWTVRGFPFTIIYTKRAECLFVLAITHSRRRPGMWLTRLE